MVRERSPAAFSDLSALVAGLALPVGMFVFSRSAPLLLAIAALLALAGLWRDGRLGDLPARAGQALSTGWGRALAALLLYCAGSLLWAHAVRPGVIAYGEFIASVAGATVLAACWAISPPRHIGRWLAAGLVLCAVFTLADLASHMAFRRLLGIRADTFVLNRTVVCALLLVWPALVLAGQGARWVAAVPAAVVALAIARSDSGAALLGLLIGALAFLAGRIAPRLTVSAIAAGALLVLAVSPVIGPVLDRALPAPLHAAMETMHAQDRINIWRSFGDAVTQRPVLGSGFNASARMADDPVARQVAEPHRVLLGSGHPHNALLQVWVEGGAVGAALLAWLMVAVARAVLRLRAGQAAACALAASGLSIAAVSHGAWQGWWIAAVGLSIVLVAQAGQKDHGHG